MDDEIRQIKSRSVLSIGSLFLQSSYSALLGFVAFFILTLKSGVYLLGIYNTVLAMMSFFNYLTNLGLAAAIVQKKEVEEKDLSTAFFLQLFLTILMSSIGLLLTNHLFRFYKDLPHQAIYLYWALLFSFIIISLKTIPSVLLERKIKIYKVVLIQGIENTLFYLSVIIFSLLGFDIYSLIIAVLLRAIVGTVAIYYFNPWLPKLIFSLQSAKSLLSYGIPFQGNSFLALIKDDLLIIYLGGLIGFKNLGYLTFGKKYGEFALRLITDNINRVAFPLFSRFQKEEYFLKKSLEKVLFYETFLVFPIIIGSLFIFDSALKIFPGYFDKWNLAIFSFYFFSLSTFFVSLTTPFINLFNSIGKVKLSLYFMVLWTILIWILVPLFSKTYGHNGVSIAFFLMSLTFIFVLSKARSLVKFNFRESVLPNLMATIAMASYLGLIRLTVSTDNILLHLSLSIAGAAVIYLSIIYIFKRQALFKELLELFKLKNG